MLVIAKILMREQPYTFAETVSPAATRAEHVYLDEAITLLGLTESFSRCKPS